MGLKPTPVLFHMFSGKEGPFPALLFLLMFRVLHTQRTVPHSEYPELFMCCSSVHSSMRLLGGYLENGEYAVRNHLGDSLNCPDSYRNLGNKSQSSLQHPYQPSCKNPSFHTSSQAHWLQQSCTHQRDDNVTSADCPGVCANEPHRTADSLGRLVTHQS